MTAPAEPEAALANVEYAAWRYRAALVRDREEPYQAPPAAQFAGVLARLLDFWEDCGRRERAAAGAANLAGSLETTISILVSRLLAAGVAPQPLPTGGRPPAAVRTYRETLRHLKETSLEAAQTWRELTPADRERLLSPVAFLASVARTLTREGLPGPPPRPADGGTASAGQLVWPIR